MARKNARDIDAIRSECTLLGHAWYEADTDKRPMFGVYVPMRCDRCGTLKLTNVDLYGNFLGRRYLYPDGYQYRAAEGETPPSRQEWRRRFLRNHGYISNTD